MNKITPIDPSEEPRVQIYKDDPTAGATDGDPVSDVYDPDDALWNPVRVKTELRANFDDVSDPIPLAIRCVDGWTTVLLEGHYGRITIKNLDNVTEWRLAHTEAELESATWGAPLEFASPIEDTNTVFYAQARADDPEGAVQDYSVMLWLEAQVEPQGWQDNGMMHLFELQAEDFEDQVPAGIFDGVDVAIGRFSATDGPGDIDLCLVYIYEGEAHVAYHEGGDLVPLELCIGDMDWEYLGSLGPAVDVAVEWDGYWALPDNQEGIWWTRGNEGTRWIKISEGEPWFFWVTAEGELKAQEGMGGSTLSLAMGVDSCAALRSWKNVRFPDRDHGLIVAYIRDGDVFYRNRCTQADESIIWESEKPGEANDPLFDGTVIHVQPFRTNDYRTGFLAVVDGETEWIITERNWAGMAISHERISASLTNFTADLVRIHYEDIFLEENITASLESLGNWLLWASETEVKSAENIMTAWPVEGEELGEGDGTETVFPIDYEPIEDTETIYFDATAQDPETYTIYPVDHEEYGYSAEVEFNEAPPSNVLITADYEWENWGRRVRIVFEHGIRNPTGQDDFFHLEDAEMNSYSVDETYPEDTWYKVGQTPQHPDILDTMWQVMVLETADLNVSEGDITVIYDGTGGLLGEAEQDVSSFTFTFTPENLVILDLPVPEVEAIYNE